MLSQADTGEMTRKQMNAACRILERVLEGYPDPLAVYLWNSQIIQVGQGQPAFTLHLRHPAVLRDLVLFQDPVRLAEAYFRGEVEVQGDFDAALGLREHLATLHLPVHQQAWLALHALVLDIGQRFPRRSSRLPAGQTPGSRACRSNGRESIAFHYDISNAFFGLWLDERMVYSCAYFESSGQSLEQAQCNKLDHICRKLRLKPGERLLDIGCGWGALVCWAASHYGVRAHGITLSSNQYQYALQEIQRQGLQRQVSVELRDYRDMEGAAVYDKVVSVGMFEHVGLKNLPNYFAVVHRVLKPGGLFLNHGITSAEPGWSRGVSTRFINRHVFPDGELDTVSNVLSRMEEADFEIFDVEGLRPHYALTLRHWLQRLEAQAEGAARLVGERTYRVWRLYLAGCALQFEQGATGIHQILAVRKQGGLPDLPLTRRDVYVSGLSIT